MRRSCLLSYTDHLPLEAINKELSRHESNSQQAIIMELSCEESCCSAGNNQAAEQAGITQHSWQLSRRSPRVEASVRARRTSAAFPATSPTVGFSCATAIARVIVPATARSFVVTERALGASFDCV